MPPDLNGLSVPCASRVSRDHPSSARAVFVNYTIVHRVPPGSTCTPGFRDWH